MTRDLTRIDVDELIGVGGYGDRLVDVTADNCSICGALVRDEWFARLKHAEWHIKNGDASV